MAPAQAARPAALSTLSSITNRLAANINEPHLPHVVSALLGGLVDCGPLLSLPRQTRQGTNGQAAVTLHKFFSLLQTLLHSPKRENVEQRWAGAVLVKAAIEFGGHEVLGQHGAKVFLPGLLAALRRPDPPSTRAIYIATLARLFALARPYPSLVRELATPNLPQFVKTCLSNITSPLQDNRELKTALCCFCELVQHHPTIFRAFTKDIGALLETILGVGDAALKTPTTLHFSRDSKSLAARLSSLMHSVEPKQGAGLSWELALSTTLDKVHRAVDAFLVSVDEQLDSKSTAAKQYAVQYMTQRSTEERIGSIVIYTDRILSLLNLLSHQVLTSTTTVVVLPIHSIDALVQRLLSTVVLSSDYQLPKFTPGSSHDEKDAVVAGLPTVHIATLAFVSSLASRLQQQVSPLVPSLVSRIRWAFKAEASNDDFRASAYQVLAELVGLAGSIISRDSIAQLGDVIVRCCQDFTSAHEMAQPQDRRTAGAALMAEFTKDSATENGPRRTQQGLVTSAGNLLKTVYTKLPSETLPAAVRTHMDRAAILTRSSDLLAASVLYPAKRKDGGVGRSLLPFLVQTDSGSDAVEALVRPRMPVLQSGRIEEGPLAAEARSESSDLIDRGGSASAVQASLGNQAQEELLSVPVVTAEVPEDHNGAKREMDDAPPKDDGKRPRLMKAAATRAEPLDTTINDEEMSADGDEMTTEETTTEETKPTEDVQPKTLPTLSAYALPQQAQAEEEDDGEFVIPELTMDVSDDEE